MLWAEKTPIGYGELWVDSTEQEVELAHVIVAQEQRGKGYGVALVRLLLDAARQTPFRDVFLRVVPDNRAAIGCYLRAGFAPVEDEAQAAFNQGQPLAYLWMRSV